MDEPVLYVLLRGSIVATVGGSDGITAVELFPGDAFNEEALLPPPESDAVGPPGVSFLYVATQDCDLAALPASAFDRFHPRDSICYAPHALLRYTERADESDADVVRAADAAAEFFARTLAGFGIFAHLPRAARCDLVREVCLITAGKGAVLRKEGEPMEAHFAVVLGGTLDVQMATGDSTATPAAGAAARRASGASSGSIEREGADVVDAVAEALRVTRRRSFVLPPAVEPAEPPRAAAGRVRNPGAPTLCAQAAAGGVRHVPAFFVGSTHTVTVARASSRRALLSVSGSSCAATCLAKHALLSKMRGRTPLQPPAVYR